MKAVKLVGTSGLKSLHLVDIARPEPARGQLLIEVKAAGVNFAELQTLNGKYPPMTQIPYVMGFEAAGTVTAVGPDVHNFKVGDRVTSLVSSGGHAEYALADQSMAIPIPENVSFVDATAIPVNGLTAYALLKHGAKIQKGDTVLIQAAAGGVGLFLIQLAKLFGCSKVIALAGSQEKLELVNRLGADFAFNYNDDDWQTKVLAATNEKGVDVVLECVSGAIGDECYKLVAAQGRIIVFGAANLHDSYSPEQITQLIRKNLTITGFNLPTMQSELLASCILALLKIITNEQIELHSQVFALNNVQSAYAALAGRTTIGKVILVP
ncbi:MAG: zinc-binding dehydrogenase [Candidatus Obscuribacterales bacterium]|jgi:NADPH2:quinone reductase